VNNPETILHSANQQLSSLLHCNPLPLQTGGSQLLQDPLWVWGVLGGKDVGKSSLINALAESDLACTRELVGEGTYQPAVYLTRDDLTRLQDRFAGLSAITVTYHAEAPPAMQGLALVDLPDFDSLFTDHLDQVRRVSCVLDGIIWLTTPKKVGDLKAIREIQQVLKARPNFVYVVNKMDWLLGQSDQPAQQELRRMRTALSEQIAACDGGNGDQRSFMISARYRSAAAILEAIASSRKESDPQRIGDISEELSQAASQVENDFETLQRTLTMPPAADVVAANKQANLSYQVKTQARQLLDHHKPLPTLQRLQRVAGPQQVAEIADYSFSTAYCVHLLGQISSEKVLFPDWSSQLFKKRLSFWSLLGLIAWPVALLGRLWGSLGSMLPGSNNTARDLSFTFEGIPLEDRADSTLAGLHNILARVDERIEFDLPSGEEIAQQFRREVLDQADSFRSRSLMPLLEKKPSLVGRVFRWVFPFAVLIWFPFLQPLLAGLLVSLQEGNLVSMDTLLLLVETLSASNVLVGLAVSLLILAALTAAIYSVSARDTCKILDRLKHASPQVISEPLTGSLIAMLYRPIDKVRSQLAELATTLQNLN